MPAQRSSLIDRLITLIGDLRPAEGTSLKQLEEARVAVARAVAAEQFEPVARVTKARPVVELQSLAAEQRAGIEKAVDAVASAPEQAPQFLVARREVPLSATTIQDISPDWAAGRAIDSSIGPFLDAVGRPVWIDFFQIVTQTRLVRSPGAAPFLTFPLQGLAVGGDRLTLPAGSIWIASQQIAPGAPAGSYTALKIKVGTLTFSHSLSISNNEIVVPPTVTCTLDLKLDPGTVASGTGAGEDARRAAADVPKTVTFVFDAGGAKITAVAKARLRAYGSTVKIDVTMNPPAYVADVARIFVPAISSEQAFVIADVQSDELRLAGQADIVGAAWALPVAVVSPASLGNAAGAGGLALTLQAGLTLTWKGQSAATTTGPATLIVDAGLITFAALTVHSLGAHETILLWSKKPGDPPSSSVDLRWPAQFALRFFSAASGTELLLFFGSIRGNFDRPVTVGGKRVFVQSKNALIIFVESAVFTGVIIEAVLDPPPLPAKALAFAIANSVFRTTPAETLLLVMQWDGVTSKAGGVAIGFGLQFLLPTLPDPYAGNINLEVLRDAGTRGLLNALVFWLPAKPPSLTYTFPSSALTAASDAVPPPVATTNDRFSSTAFARPAAVGLPGGLILLDLSTNVDQFGVGWLPRTQRGETTAEVSPFAVESMYLVSQSQSVFVITVPAVQWEPVFTETQLPPPSPLFPTLVSFADNGGPTALGVQSVQLVRVAPAPVLDFLVDNFTSAPTPQPAVAHFTLPFGMEAFANLKKPGDTSPRGATVSYNRPEFATESVTGGYQISIRAVDPAAPDSPSLEGWTLQRLGNLVPPPVPVPPAPARSVLDTDVDTIFNDYLGPGSPNAQVPVTRIDFSGYGESLFSHWVNPSEAAVAVTQAKFDVLIGRTALEVVQVRSVLYPYAVRVVRTITIQRQNSGSVVRHDSGWQAVTDGEYLFPGIGLSTHPGIVTKIRDVTNIRDTGQIIDLTGGAEVAGVIFDGDLTIENAVKGATPTGVPARGQIGYVQLKPTGGSILTAAQYAELIQKAGPLGGNVDCVLNVGNSGQLMKLGRVGVGVTQGMGGAEFVMTAWGSPQFPQGGQWSFLRQTGGGTAPEVVDKDLGVPLIRAGAAPAPPAPNSPYRFADPVDLGTPGAPASDYGIVHATGTQRLFFPRPKIEAGSTQITSMRVPILADPYSLANSVGYFPRTDAAIPFDNPNYALTIAGGNYRLQPAPNFPVAVGQRTISEAGGVRSYVDYTGSVAELAIDTAAPVPWTFRLDNVNFALSSSLMGEVIRVTATVDAAANLLTTLKDPKIIFGGALGVVQDIMTFLKELGVNAPLYVSMTNKLTFKAGQKLSLDDAINKLLPPNGPQFDDTDVVISLVIDTPLSEADFELGATILIPTSFPPIVAVGMAKVEIKMSTESGNTFTLTVGAGVGVSIDLGIKIKAYYLETMFLIAGDSVLGFGVGLLIKGTVDLEVVSVDVSVEAKMALLKVEPSATCPATTIYGAAQLTFAIEITICWVIDIDIEVQTEIDQKLNGGPCDLPDVL